MREHGATYEARDIFIRKAWSAGAYDHWGNGSIELWHALRCVAVLQVRAVVASLSESILVSDPF